MEFESIFGLTYLKSFMSFIYINIFEIVLIYNSWKKLIMFIKNFSLFLLAIIN